MASTRPGVRRGITVALAGVLALAAPTTPVNARRVTGTVRTADGADAVPNSYIVVLTDAAVGVRAGAAADPATVRATADGLARRYGGQVRRSFGPVLNGFEATMSARAAERLAADASVASVEQNHTVTPAAVQHRAAWGLDRIDQRRRPLSGTYTYGTQASNVTVYVIDTGIRLTHKEFGGRVRSGLDVIDGGRADDCQGHGTHVAGTIGGRTHGVAKGVRLVSIRVLNCSGKGSVAGILAGIAWVTVFADKPAVANMSLGGRPNRLVDGAVRRSIKSGITYVVAAGNRGANACSFSPARVAQAITVGATTRDDARARYSNHGPCLDVFAPGSAITSAWRTGDAATRTVSGTSMAAAHVTGAAALVLARHRTYTPDEVRSALVADATRKVLTRVGRGSTNRLLHVD